jgi:hypothetical protein
VVLPLVSLALRSAFSRRDLVVEAPDVGWADFATWHGLERAAGVLLLTGTFPAVTLMAYLFAGMAIGRLDLHSPVVARRRRRRARTPSRGSRRASSAASTPSTGPWNRPRPASG